MMNSENVFWVEVWRVIGVTLIGLVTVVASCTVVEVWSVENMVKAGAHPLDARCAVSETRTVCAIRAAR